MAEKENAKTKVRQLLPFLTEVLLESDTESDSDSSCEEGVTVIPRDLPKSRGYFGLVDKMDEAEFKSHFRLGFSEFYSLYCFIY